MVIFQAGSDTGRHPAINLTQGNKIIQFCWQNFIGIKQP